MGLTQQAADLKAAGWEFRHWVMGLHATAQRACVRTGWRFVKIALVLVDRAKLKPWCVASL